MGCYSLKYSSVLESEAQMSATVEQLLDDHGVAASTKRKFLLSLSEAFTNALVHGNGLDAKKQIIVRIEINDNSISADIIDEGKGGLEKINKRNQPALLAESGRGVDLIRHYCTMSDFVEISTGGLKVTLVLEHSKEKIT